MRKNLLLLALFGGIFFSATSAISYPDATFKEFPTPEVMNETGGTQVLGISRNGRFIYGGTYVAGGFVYDVKLDTMYMAAAAGVSDDGWTAGTLRSTNLLTGENRYLEGVSGYGFIMSTSISGDGAIITGCGGPNWTELEPLYWENGKVHILPYPTTAQVGDFKVNGCRAQGVSADGSIIYGYFIANPNTYPLIVWERQEDGTYEYIDTWSELYEPLHQWVYDYDSKTYDFVRGDKPYCWFEPMAMSADGKLIVMRTQINTEDPAPPTQVGYYHTDTRTFELAPFSEDNIIFKEGNCIINQVSNDGTAAGITQMLNLSDAIPFLMPYMGEPQFLNDIFPQFDRLDYYQDNKDYKGGLPYLCTSISADGRFIAGYSTDVITYYRGFDSTEDFGFWGYVIDTDPSAGCPENNEGSGVESIAAEEGDEGPEEYYTLQGLRVQNPDHGIYIVRSASGKTRKVVI